MSLELAELAESVNQDDAIRVVVLSGRGRTFSSGWEAVRVRTSDQQGLRAAAAIARIEKPVVAAINGDAVGQGLELALAADLRIAAKGTRLGMPHLRKGAIPWDGGTSAFPGWSDAPRRWRCCSPGDYRCGGGLAHRGQGRWSRRSSRRRGSGGPAPAPSPPATPRRPWRGPPTSPWPTECAWTISPAHHQGQEGIRSFTERRPPRFRGR